MFLIEAGWPAETGWEQQTLDKNGAGPSKAPPHSDAELARRLKNLDQRLHREQEEAAARATPQGPGTENAALVFRFASEFVAGVLVGALIGWGIDWLAGTSPLFLILFLLIGFAAALTNMVRVAKATQAKYPVGKDMPEPDNEDDA